MFARSRWAIGATCGALILALVGCSSSSKSSTQTATTGAAAQAGSSAAGQGVTSDQILIGGVASLTSPQGPVFPGADTGAQAAFEAVNRQGGINGRKIKYIFKDDGSNPSTNLTDIQQLVLQDHVFAMAPVTSEVFLPGASDFLKNQNVPFTGWGFQPGFCGNPAGFGFNGCLVSTNVANLAILGPLSKVLPKGASLAFIADNTTSGQSAIKQAQTAADSYGFKMVYSKAILPIDNPVTDFSPYVSALVGSHADLIVTDSGSFANDVGLDGALKAAGYKGPTMNFVTYVPGLLTSSPSVASAINGAYTNIQFAPQEQGGPAVAQIEKDLVAIGQKPLISIGVATSYWSAELMIAMLKDVGRDLTPDNFMKKINGGFNWTPSPSGGVGPVSFPQDHSDPAPCAALVVASGQVYKSAAPLECYKTVTYSK